MLEQLGQRDPDLTTTRHLVQQFMRMVRERRGRDLEAWVANVQGTGPHELRGFSRNLRRDWDAVHAGLTKRPFLYALGRQGVPIVQARTNAGAQPVQVRRLDRLDHMFIDHDLKAAALWANLTSELGTGAVRSWRWLSERELRARRMRVRDPDTERWLPFLPDAYFEITYADGDVQAVVVEIDMGTLTLRRFARKIRSFELALESGLARRHFGQEDAEMLVLTHSPRRLDWLRKTAERQVSSDRSDAYFFGTFENLDARIFPHARWLDLDGTAVAGLFYGV